MAGPPGRTCCLAFRALIRALVLVPIQLKQRALLNRFDHITADYLRLSKVWQISARWPPSCRCPSCT